tara:strand:- start:3189 stop:3767 length:579 start_codon:yes stop_codon:yes gene_type:complete
MSLLYSTLAHRRKAYRSSNSIILLATQTASSDASLAFTSYIDSTYNEYIFEFENLHSTNDGANLTFQAGGSYNTTITSGAFRSENSESGSNNFGYAAANAQAQGTGEQILFHELDNDNDSSVCGELHLFNPSSTTFVKNWYSRVTGNKNSTTSMSVFTGGNFNTTSAFTQVRFTIASGSIQSGTIRMYGVTQ